MIPLGGGSFDNMEDQLSEQGSVLRWEMATQTEPVEFKDPKLANVTVHDLVEDLHEK